MNPIKTLIDTGDRCISSIGFGKEGGMDPSEDLIDTLRLRLAAKPAINWVRTLRDLACILLLWLVGALVIIGAFIVLSQMLDFCISLVRG